MSRTVDRMMGALTSAGPKSEAAHTQSLREHAAGSGWPQELVQGLSVSHTKSGHFEVQVHPSVASEVHDREYGTLTSRPDAALRRWTHSLDTKVIDATLASSLKGIL